MNQHIKQSTIKLFLGRPEFRTQTPCRHASIGDWTFSSINCNTHDSIASVPIYSKQGSLNVLGSACGGTGRARCKPMASDVIRVPGAAWRRVARARSPAPLSGGAG
uniref:Uncharacterized protein n=1 Tax=Arundo donax TaxID=35708 RepID=A0A0A9GSZ0_ARUDO